MAKKKNNNVADGVMFNAQAGLRAGEYKTISEALIKEHKKAKKLYGNR